MVLVDLDALSEHGFMNSHHTLLELFHTHKLLPLNLQTTTDIVQRQALYEISDAPEIKSPQLTTRRNRRAIKLSTQVLEQKPKKDSATKSESDTVKNIVSHPTSSTSKRKQKKEPSTTAPTQQREHRHQRRTERSQRPSNIQQSKAAPEANSKNKSPLQLQPEQPGSDKSTSPSRSVLSTVDSFESRSSHSKSRSRSSRLEFDGAIKSLTQSTSEIQAQKLFIDSVWPSEQQKAVKATDTLSRSSRSNTIHSSRSSQRYTPNESSPSIERNRSANKTMSATVIGSIGGKVEMAPEKSETTGLVPGDEESEICNSGVVANGEVPSSGCTRRKKIVWGAIVCAIIAVAVTVPCILIFGGFLDGNGSNFPDLSKAKRGEVVASFSTDICNESVPKSGLCTPSGLDEEQHGGQLCNLVAKSMLNTTIYGDIALINAGICEETLLAPDLSVGNIKDAISAENLVVVEIPGSDVINVLNQALTATFGKSGNSQAYPYAAGLRYSVEANLPLSERLSNIEVNRGLRDDEWEPIDIRRFYKVVTTEKLANGGMGYFENVIDDWKDPLNIKTGDAFYNYAMQNVSNYEWSELPNSEYSTQYFIGESEESAIAVVPTRICHALIPGQPESSFCTAADVVHGGEVCNLVSWTIRDQNFGLDMVVLKGDSCAGDIEEGKFVESAFETVLSDNQSLVTLDLLGSEIVTMIDEHVSSAVRSGMPGNYPYAAGLKFDVNTSSSPIVSNVQILAPSGRWLQIVGTKTYTVATTSDLANSSSAQDMGTTMKEEIISYAEDWKILYKTPADKASTQSYV